MLKAGSDRLAHTSAPPAGSVRPGAGRPAVVRAARGDAWLPRAVLAAIVLGLHAVVLYAVLHRIESVAPAVSIPMTITLATATEPARAVPRPAPPEPKPRPRRPPALAPTATPAPMPEPVPRELPAEEPPTETPAVAEVPAPLAETPSAQAQPSPPAASAPRFDAAYLNNPVPAYPPLSRRLGERGRVLLRVYVRPDGSAREVHVHASSGHARLDRAAKDAVERWQFVPARAGDEPVGAWVLVPVSFTLSQG